MYLDKKGKVIFEFSGTEYSSEDSKELNHTYIGKKKKLLKNVVISEKRTKTLFECLNISKPINTMIPVGKKKKQKKTC